jgi:hypothetical protein
MKKFRIFGIFVLGLVLLALVVAIIGAPTGLYFSDNTTVNYDKEGNFTVNWTAPTGAVANYSVYVYADGIFYNKAVNNSATGYTFSNATDANYTFHIAAVNATDAVEGTNSTNISIVVDTTSPAINTIYPTNTYYVTAPVNFNYTYTEANCDKVWYSNDSGVTNYSVQACGVNFSSMVAGASNTWIVYMNDSAGNENSSSVTFTIDTTNPVASASCSPTSVYVSASVTCTCSGSDSGSGINSSLTTAGSTPSTSSVGTFSYTCSVTDNVGNTDSDTASYEVIRSTSSGLPKYYPTALKLSEGYEIRLGKRWKVYFESKGEDHVLEVGNISEEKVKITISSNPITFEINVGESKKVDLDSDGNYDLEVLFESYSSYRGNFVLTSIDETIIEEEIIEETAIEEAPEEIEEEKEKGSWGWFVILVLVLVGGLVAWKKGLFNRSEQHEEFRK